MERCNIEGGKEGKTHLRSGSRVSASKRGARVCCLETRSEERESASHVDEV